MPVDCIRGSACERAGDVGQGTVGRYDCDRSGGRRAEEDRGERARRQAAVVNGELSREESTDDIFVDTACNMKDDPHGPRRSA